jgi:hypothetical protein
MLDLSSLAITQMTKGQQKKALTAYSSAMRAFR